LHSVHEAQDILPGERTTPRHWSAIASRSSNFATGAARAHTNGNGQGRKTQPSECSGTVWVWWTFPQRNPEGYSVEDYTVARAVDEWIEEREQDGINNVKAVYLTKRLVAWCKRNDIRHLGQIQTQALGHWRTTEWEYAQGIQLP
jgi:hypothetical protein